MTLPEPSALREAADWFAHMRGPDAASSRQDFDRWLAASEANRDAYSRVAETFSLGKHLAGSRLVETRTNSRTKRALLMTVAAAGMIAAAGLSYVSLPQAPTLPTIVRSDPRDFRTEVGEIRATNLMDGSRITLDTGTEVVADMSDTRRDIRMTQGRARFEVAHDGRPFVVHVPDGTITARGTVFDVRIADGRTQVHLLRGAIDVKRASRPGMVPEIRRLVTGQAVAFGSLDRIAPPSRSDRAQILQPGWPDALLAFERISLRDLATEANRYSKARLTIAPALAAVCVSGTFRVGDLQRLADRLAVLLDVVAVSGAGDDVELRSARPTSARRRRSTSANLEQPLSLDAGIFCSREV